MAPLLSYFTLVFLLFIQAGHSKGCLRNERIGLLEFKSKLEDPGHLLSSWKGDNCCNWRCVTCQNDTGHVLELNLRNSNDLKAFGLNGEIDSSLLALTHLIHLDLSGNNFNETQIPSFLGLFQNLEYLNLSFTNFGGAIPSQFKEAVPNWLQNLTSICNLKFLDLNGLVMKLNVKDLMNGFSCSWKKIEVLSLASNSLQGDLFGNWLTKVPNLIYLDLSNNSISGVIPIDIGKLSNLEYLSLSSNSLHGTVSELHLNNLTKLQVLRLAWNSLIINTSATNNHHWFPKFQLQVLVLGSCQVGPKFPSWLKSQLSIYFLGLRNTSIQDTLPSWFWIRSYRFVDIGYNKLSGYLPHSISSSLSFLDISYNYFSGSLPSISISNKFSLAMFMASNNQFGGTIPSQFCEMYSLSILDLANNNFSGEFPNCTFKSKKLSILNLAYNNLFGRIYSSIGSLVNLQVLSLNNNHFNGEIPLGLQYCTKLIILNLANNNLSGEIPTWLGESLSNLVFLQLRENEFVGSIPSQLALLSNLQVLDLAGNNLIGSVPQSFGNFSAMSSMSKYTLSRISFHLPSVSQKSKAVIVMYTNQLAIITKGQVLEYSNTLYLVKTIDLSRNNLSGSIPSEIGALVAVQTLNFSRNYLNGQIPNRIGDLKSLDSLDLSFNDFSGEIPQSLSLLTFLSHLNLSYNNLSGPIPFGNQLSTLNDTSLYIGNAFLCGPPTNQSCLSEDPKNNTVEIRKTAPFVLSFDFSVVMGFLAGLWAVWCVLLLNTTWRISYFEMIDDVFYKLQFR